MSNAARSVDGSEEGETGERVQLSEIQVLAMAGAAWIGALAAWPVPVVCAVAVAVGGFVLRRPMMVVVAVGLAATGLGNRAVDAFEPVEATVVMDVTMTVVDDPRPLGSAWRCTLRLVDGARVDAWAYGSAGFALAKTSVGDRVMVSGRLRPLEDSSWTRSRHLLGRLSVDQADVVSGPSGLRAFVERVRSPVVAGAQQLPEDLRPLYLGLVVGDDRFQSPERRARFATAGLAHLLAVSGQNVAFVLTVARPVIERFGPRVRLAATIGILLVFAAATRMEPSVLRATVTAGLAVSASVSGHRQSGVRLLGLAVTALVLVDPFLVHSVGFQLSVSASLGILVLAPVLQARTPGPRFLVVPLSVTSAAQAAVSPLLLYRFGPVSLVSVPANLVAGWAAGAVMMWGLTGGVVAGAVGGDLGTVLQLPARAALLWLDAVAAWASRMPFPAPDPVSLAALLVLVVALSLVRPRSGRAPGRAQRLAAAVLVAVMVAVAVPAVPRPPSVPVELVGGGTWLPSVDGSPSVLIVSADADEHLVGELVSLRVRSIDLVVVSAGGGPGLAAARAVTGLVGVGTVLAPPRHRLVGARRITEEFTVDLGEWVLRIRPVDNRLEVSID